jgi:molecular chaperone DnaK
MSTQDVIVGIDLGTTNSEIAAFVDGRPQVLSSGTTNMLASCVGLSPTNELLIGAAARNQLMVYPERTVKSVKRKMGTDEVFTLGDKRFSPPEISALILRELAQWAEAALGQSVRKAVITVPAYFSDAQRQATREAGELAGLEVLRVLNEPTAASLAYGCDDSAHRTVMVYDLGGGTFDVSIVSIEGDVTEVLASHGNNQLGGDDFDELLLSTLLSEFETRHKIDLKDRHPAAYARLRRAAEEAKKRLSSESYVRVREEALVTEGGKPLHLDMEVSRQTYEDLIRPLVESTLDSVFKAMEDAGKLADDIDVILLVGGSTRTPLIREMLEERIGTTVRQDVHPDLCVALGAGLLASRLQGHDVERVLVDISPYSFGPSYLSVMDGRQYSYCYHPIIHRNTPLPITRTDSYYTAVPFQKVVEIKIFQGEDPDALKNVLVGKFTIEGFTPVQEENEVLCRMSLDLDGILKVEAIEKRTGLSKHITIRNATQPMSDADLARARQRLEQLHDTRSSDSLSDEGIQEAEFESVGSGEPGERAQAPENPELAIRIVEAESVLKRSRSLLETVHAEDKEEMIDLHEQIDEAIDESNIDSLSQGIDSLKELLFFVEGK